MGEFLQLSKRMLNWTTPFVKSEEYTTKCGLTTGFDGSGDEVYF